jgi:hypothetical protein
MNFTSGWLAGWVCSSKWRSLQLSPGGMADFNIYDWARNFAALHALVSYPKKVLATFRRKMHALRVGRHAASG